jgi:acyl-CoA dehydrogenase
VSVPISGSDISGSDVIPGSDVGELANSVFADKVGHDVVLKADGAPLPRDLWDLLSGLDLTGIGIAESAGGSGGTVADVVALLDAAGRHAVPLPLLEHHLALWLVIGAGGRAPGGGAAWTAAPPQDSLTVCDAGTVTGILRDVAWGADADRVVALVEDSAGSSVVIVKPADAAAVAPGRDLAGQPRDTLTFDGAPAEVLTGAVTADRLAQRGAVLRAAQMAGAMGAVYDLTQAYTAQRVQFGRPIGKFQSVRTHLVYLAQMAVMTRVSADRAAAALEGDGDASFAAYAAKLLANQNAAVSVRSGHQAHGAIGMTREYALQDLTRRLNAWRGDWGTEQALADRIGGAVASAVTAQTHGIATIATDEGSLSV